MFVAPTVLVMDRFDNPCTLSNSVCLLNEEPPSTSSPSNHFGLNPVEMSNSCREQKGLTHRALYAAGAHAGVKCQRWQFVNSPALQERVKHTGALSLTKTETNIDKAPLLFKTLRHLHVLFLQVCGKETFLQGLSFCLLILRRPFKTQRRGHHKQHAHRRYLFTITVL